jgi:hypothetical protein
MRRILPALTLLTALTSSGLAAERGAGREVRIERRPEGKVVYVVPPLIIEGKVQRPEALLVLPRPQVSYEWPELRRDSARTPALPAPPVR